MVEAVGLSVAGSSLSASVRTTAASAATQAASATQTGAVDVRPLSPSTRSDPTTGVLITEYFSPNGQVNMQIPSQAAIAYMRSGLSLSDKAAEEGASGAKPTEESGVVA